MTLFVVFLLMACAAVVGYFWPWNSDRITNPKRHPAADAEYVVIYIDGDPHAFTDEQIVVARDRAKRLRIP